MNCENQSQKAKEKHSVKKDIDSEEEKEIEQESINENEENEEDDIDENDEKKEMRTFTIELIIHTKVMDNREEIKKCICHNHILSEKHKNKTKEELEQKENIYIEKEIIPSIEIPVIRDNDQTILPQLNNIESPDKFYIKLSDLTKTLQNIGFPMSGSKINIFVGYANNYIYLGTEPIDEKTVLYSFMLEPNKDLIKMKIINYVQKRVLDGYTNSIVNTYFRKPIPKIRPKSKENQNALPSLEIKKIFTPSMTNLDYYAEVSDNEETHSSGR